ncbi:tetratricopeptide repeat protein [Nonomuraea rubra]|uniref:tetratricopeptide repeat protein n=1 Tax=Nonomuraea rubra TaxID=46180 RepID=UPI0033DA721E
MTDFEMLPDPWAGRTDLAQLRRTPYWAHLVTPLPELHRMLSEAWERWWQRDGAEAAGQASKLAAEAERRQRVRAADPGLTHSLLGAAKVISALVQDEPALFAEAMDHFWRDQNVTRAAPQRAFALLSCGLPDEAERVTRLAIGEGQDTVQNAFVLARALADLDRHADAFDILDRANRRWPGDLRSARLQADLLGPAHDARTTEAVMANLGEASSQAGLHEEAEAAYRAALEAAPGRSDLLVRLGRVLAARHGEAEAAGEALAQAADLTSAAGLRLEAATQFSVAERHEDALRQVELALKSADGDPEVHYACAQVLLSIGRPERALGLLRSLAFSPPDPRVLTLEGMALHAIGQADEAAELLTRSDEQSPRQPLTMAELGLVRTEQGRFYDALLMFGKVLDLEPDDLRIRAVQGLVRLVLEDHGGVDDLEIAMGAGFDAPWAHEALGLALEFRGDPARALDEYAAASYGSPQDAVVAVRIAEIHLREKRYEQSRDCYERALRIDPGSAEALLGLVDVATAIPFSASYLAELEARLREALEFSPGSIPLHYALAQVMRLRGSDEGRTREQFRQVVGLQPVSAGEWQLRGMAVEALDQPEQALESYLRGLDPGLGSSTQDKAVLHLLAGSLLMDLDQEEPAEEHLRQAVDLDAADPQARVRLGALYQRRERHEEAVTCLRAAAQLDPLDADTWAMLGEALLQLNRLPEAVEALEQARAQGEGRPEIHAVLGDAYRMSARYRDALPELEQAGAGSTGDPWLLSIYGTVLHVLGRDTEAAAALRRVVADHPGDLFAVRQLRDTFMALRCLDDAVEITRSAAEDGEPSPEATSLYGETLQLTGRPGPAVDVLGAGVRDWPNDLYLRCSYGWALLAAKRPGEALQQFEQAVAISPVDDTYALVELAAARRRRKLYDEALEALDTALERDPSDMYAWIQRSWALSDIGCWTEAAEAATRGTIPPAGGVPEADAFRALASALSVQNRPEAMLAACDRALELDPQSPAAHEERAAALHELGRAEESRAASIRVLELLDDKGVSDEYTEWRKGFSQYRLGQLKDAEQTLGAIVDDVDSPAGVLFDLGLIRLAGERPATAEYERALAAAEAEPVPRRRGLLDVAISDLRLERAEGGGARQALLSRLTAYRDALGPAVSP